ncbi:MAG: helix-turn-helix domain-containing protein [Porticoccaceae bacterium]
MHQHIANVIENLLLEQGLPVRPLQELATKLGPDTLLSAAQADQLYSCAISLYPSEGLVNGAHLGIDLGQRLELVSIGMFGYALMTAATVGEVINLLLRYVKAILPSIEVSSLHNDGSVRLQIHANHLPARLREFYVDVLFSAVKHNLAVLAPSTAAGVAAELPYDRLEKADQIFSGCVSYGHDIASLVIDKSILIAPINTSDPVAQSVFRRHCDRIIGKDSHAGLVSEQVKHQLISCHSHFPTCSEIAQRLNVSESTLRRKLAKEGSRFQLLLDQVRYRLAREYLQQTDLPVAEIAVLLDFDNATNFRRAFKRWSGKTPKALREGGFISASAERSL